MKGFHQPSQGSVQAEMSFVEVSEKRFLFKSIHSHQIEFRSQACD
tara:strand:+ start:81 stop:215 length:135 start_codon:yes stop_codon:yes gene_type:complete